MSIAIQHLGPAHAALLAGMHRICFAEPWDAKAMTDLLSMPGSYGYLAAEAQPQGFILCRTAADEAEVLTFLVLPPYRRRGLAGVLLEQAIGRAWEEGAKTMFLEVAGNNHAAQDLYAAHGFTEVGRRRGYYAGCIDALVMARALQPQAPEGPALRSTR